jgi:hypothetical protein
LPRACSTISTIERQLLSNRMRCSHLSAAESQRQELWMHRAALAQSLLNDQTVIAAESARFSECVHVARTSASLKHSTAAGAQGRPWQAPDQHSSSSAAWT